MKMETVDIMIMMYIGGCAEKVFANWVTPCI